MLMTTAAPCVFHTRIQYNNRAIFPAITHCYCLVRVPSAPSDGTLTWSIHIQFTMRRGEESTTLSYLFIPSVYPYIRLYVRPVFAIQMTDQGDISQSVRADNGLLQREVTRHPAGEQHHRWALSLDNGTVKFRVSMLLMIPDSIFNLSYCRWTVTADSKPKNDESVHIAVFNRTTTIIIKCIRVTVTWR